MQGKAEGRGLIEYAKYTMGGGNSYTNMQGNHGVPQPTKIGVFCCQDKMKG